MSKQSTATAFAVMAAFLLWGIARAQDVVDSSGGTTDGAPVASTNGYSPNATISQVSGISIDQYKLTVKFQVPITPTFKTGGASYGITANYDSNISTQLVDTEHGNP